MPGVEIVNSAFVQIDAEPLSAVAGHQPLGNQANANQVWNHGLRHRVFEPVGIDV